MRFNRLALLLVVLPCFLCSRLNAASSDLDDLRKAQQAKLDQQQTEQQQAQDRDALNRKLREAFAPLPKQVYLSLKEAGVEFDDATALFQRLVTGLGDRIKLSGMKAEQGREFITFSSYTFLTPSDWLGAFSLKGSDRLVTFDGWLSSNKECTFALETRTFWLSAGFDASGWNQNIDSFPCADVLNGKASPALTKAMIAAANKSIK